MKITVLKSGNRIVVDSDNPALTSELLDAVTFEAREYQHMNAVKQRIRELKKQLVHASEKQEERIQAKIDLEKGYLAQPMKFVNYCCGGLDPKGRFATSWGFYSRVCRLLRKRGLRPRLKNLRSSEDLSVFEPNWDRFYRVFNDWGMELRPDQEKFLEAFFSKTQGRMDLPTGFGKTFMIGVLGILLPKARIHIVTKRASVLEQRIYPELCGMLPSVGLVKGGKRILGKRVMCYSAGSLHHSDGQADYLIADECVTGDAVIETTEGPKPLDQIVVGSKVMCFDAGVVAFREVLNVWSKGPKPILRLTFSNGKQIKCTEDHLLRTPTAWVQAGKLQLNELVISSERRLRAGLNPSTDLSVCCRDGQGSAISTCDELVGMQCEPQATPAYLDAWRISEKSLIEIEELPPENVYDIEVDRCHNFFANNLLVHNCHELSTDTLAPKLAQYLYSRNFGLSASHDMRPDNKDFRMEAVFGPIIMRRSYMQSVMAGNITPIEVRWSNVNMDINPCAGITNPVERNRKGIWNNSYRNSLIRDDARKHDDSEQTLIVVATVDHAVALKQLLPDFVLVYSADGLSPRKRKYYVDIGKLSPDEPLMSQQRLDSITRSFTRHKLKKVICTTVWNVGVDFKDLAVLIRGDAGGSPINDVQIPGRLGRLGDKTDKSVGIVYDYLDQFDTGFRRKATNRSKSYKSLEFEQIFPGKQSSLGGEVITKENCHKYGE